MNKEKETGNSNKKVDEGLQSYDCISDDLSEQKEPLADWFVTKRLEPVVKIRNANFSDDSSLCKAKEEEPRLHLDHLKVQ